MSGDAAGKFFRITDEAGNTVFEGRWDESVYDSSCGSMLQHGDFSDLRDPGVYTIRTQIDGAEYRSAPFAVGDDVFENLRRAAVRMLYLQRCGVGTVSDDPALADFMHGQCHASPALVYGENRTKDVTGGWHDAGDYGRYVVPGAKAVEDLFIAYEWSGRGDDDFGIPESGNGISDYLDEARFELEWMLKMQDENGGVYHKVTCRNFPGVVTPEEETAELVIAPISLTATADFAAVMAKASYLYRDIDPGFSQTVLSAALKAWKYGKDLPSDGGFVNPTDISTGEYPDTNDADEFFWAASELYLAGELDEEEVTARFDAQMEVGFGWQSMAGYGMWDLVRSEKAPAAIADQLKTKVLADVDAIVSSAKMDGFFMAFGENYPWGSNMSVANNGVKLSLAWKLTGEEEYRILAGQQRDYLLGVNTTGYCFVSQEGDLSPAHPHHRPSQAAGFPMKGMLAGGPNSSLEDPFAANVLSGSAPAACYVDNEQSYSTNEVAVYWNSPLITLLYGVI
ncbi:MAG: glycoside hydrolase family 9 protein, partial [Lachnospiraceae bacterium]|nr:glycoside hydrolase family 9 protein [Lachnospiraceae bacterium]